MTRSGFAVGQRMYFGVDRDLLVLYWSGGRGGDGWRVSEKKVMRRCYRVKRRHVGRAVSALQCRRPLSLGRRQARASVGT